jgi:hypothetical protein
MPLKSAALLRWTGSLSKNAARIICVLASVRRNFFNVRPPYSKIGRESEHKNKFRFGNFQSRNDFSISICLRTRLQFPRHDTEYVHQETTRFDVCIASILMKFAL